MSDERPRPSFRDVYREQYREISSSKTSRAFRIVAPVVLLIGALIALRASVVFTIVLAALAVVCFVAALVLSRRQRRGSRSG